MSAYLTPTVTATYPTFAYKEKSTPYVAPVAKTNIDAEKLQHILEEVNKTLSLPSENPSIAESEASSSYPSGANSKSLSGSTQSASETANAINFFDEFKGKAQSQVKSNFPKAYEFLEKAFNSKTITSSKSAFALFDNIRSSLDKEEFKNLEGFDKLSAEEAADIETHLKLLKNHLDLIADDFKDEQIYQMPKGKNGDEVSPEEKQAWHDKRTKVEAGLATLVPTIKSLSTIINSMESQLPSEERSFLVRLTTSFATCIGYVIGLCGGVGTPLFAGALLGSLGFEAKQFLLKQKIKEWEAFKKPLEELTNKNPLTKGNVMEKMAADSHRTQMQYNRTQAQLVTSVSGQSEDIKEINKRLSQELEEVKEKLEASEVSNKRLENKLDQVLSFIAKQQENSTAIMSKA